MSPTHLLKKNKKVNIVLERLFLHFSKVVKFWHASFLMLYVMFQHWDTGGMLHLMFQHRANNKYTEQKKYKWQKCKWHRLIVNSVRWQTHLL